MNETGYLVTLHREGMDKMGELNQNILVTADWLKSRIGSDNIIVVDCRYNLIDQNYGISEYKKGHIPGSYFLDLESHLSGSKGKHTGRHPLPDAKEFAEKMNSMGLSSDKMVVAYDDESSGSARLWWLLRYYGHDEVRILDGGIQSWLDLGYSLSKEIPDHKKGKFIPSPRENMTVELEDLKKGTKNMCIIDSRSPERYRGEVEPIDPVAGHIPGAMNIDYKSNLDSKGRYLPAKVLEDRFSGIKGDPVVYCGSGVTACVNIVAMSLAGKHVLLYPGGWSQWVSYPENPVIKENSN